MLARFLVDATAGKEGNMIPTSMASKAQHVNRPYCVASRLKALSPLTRSGTSSATGRVGTLTRARSHAAHTTSGTLKEREL